MKRYTVGFRTILAVSAIIAVAAPFLTAGSFVHMFSVVMLQMFIVIPLATIAVLLYVFNRGKNDKMHKAAKVLVSAALVLFIQTISLPILVKREAARVSSGKHYCESLVPAIEQYKQANGYYPVDIKILPETPPMPGFLAHQAFYRPGTESFSFNFHSPGSFMMSFEYDSRTKHWETLD